MNFFDKTQRSSTLWRRGLKIPQDSPSVASWGLTAQPDNGSKVSAERRDGYKLPVSHAMYMKVKGRTYSYTVVEAEEGGYLAKCIELPQVHTEGETLAEVRKNMRDALSLAVNYLRERAKKEKGQVLEITIG